MSEIFFKTAIEMIMIIIEYIFQNLQDLATQHTGYAFLYLSQGKVNKV